VKSDEEALGSVMDGRVWAEFCRELEAAGRLVMDAAPENAFDRAEGLRYVGRIAKHALDSFIERSDPTTSVEIAGLPKLGGDNPDYVYSSAPLDGACEYVLRGHVGEARYLGIGTYTGEVGTEEGLRLSGYLAGEELQPDAQGRFEVVLSSEEKPAPWLPMQPDTTQLMTRQTLSDRRQQRWAEFEIECTKGGKGAQPLRPEGYARQLDRAGRYVSGAFGQFLGWTRDFASRPNEISLLNPALAAGAQGDPSTHYYSGYFDLDEGQALVVDLVPPECDYWNIQLCNHWLESLDYEHHTTHVNDETAIARADGSVRVVVTERDPGQPDASWLDPAGHQRGCMFLRWVGTRDPFDPICRVVDIGALGSLESIVDGANA